jgi:hypothetical protein
MKVIYQLEDNSPNWQQTTSNGGASQENCNARNILKDDKKGLLITTSYVS